MRISQHALSRCKTRGIANEFLEIIYLYSRELSNNQNRFILDKSDMKRIRKTENFKDKVLERIEKQLPICLIQKNGIIVTVFRPTKSINRRERK